MTRISLLGSVGIGLVLAISVAAPASANNASVSIGPSTATYTDLTDNLCAKNNAAVGGLLDYTLAQIVRISDNSVRFQVRDNEGGGNTCTGNLAIVEDVQYILRVQDCSVGVSQCGVRETTFFS
jgi:hypothetical protein